MAKKGKTAQGEYMINIEYCGCSIHMSFGVALIIAGVIGMACVGAYSLYAG